MRGVTERQRLTRAGNPKNGVDGAEEIAGVIVAPDTMRGAAERGINAKEYLADNDAHGFFEALGDQVITGPTLTNVKISARSSCSNPMKAHSRAATSEGSGAIPEFLKIGKIVCQLY